MVSLPQRDHVGIARLVEIRVLLHNDRHAPMRQDLEGGAIGPLEHVGTDDLGEGCPRR